MGRGLPRALGLRTVLYGIAGTLTYLMRPIVVGIHFPLAHGLATPHAHDRKDTVSVSAQRLHVRPRIRGGDTGAPMPRPRLTQFVKQDFAAARTRPVVDTFPAIPAPAQAAEQRPAAWAVGRYGHLGYLPLPRLPDPLPVGAESADVVLGVQSLVEGTPDILCQLRVAQFVCGLPE